MKVSIVTISFNQARFLEEAIRSIVEQDYPEIEYIVVDPGSTDGSRDIIERYRDKIAHVIFEPDKGPADGLNKGFARATGEVFAYLNADDVLLPGAVSRMVKGFTEMPGSDVICGHGVVLDPTGQPLYKEFSYRFTLRGGLAGCSTVLQQATFFRASAFRLAGGFNIENSTCWDLELLVDMVLQGARVSLLNEFIGGFRLHDDSITGSGRLAEKYQQDIRRIKEKVISQTGMKEPKGLERALCYLQHRMDNPQAAMLRLLDEIVSRKNRKLWRRAKC